MGTVWGNQAPAAGSIRSMARRMPLPALLLLAGLLLSTLPLGWCEDAPPAATAEQTARSIEGLTSPLERSRRAAVADLIAGLPGTRSAVIAALPESTPAVQLLLVEVLAADASLPAIRALLGTMNEAEESLAVRIRLLLVRDEKTAGRVLEAWDADPSLRQDPSGKITERTKILERLLRRAEVERLFVSRKSKTGSTGSYRGQYEVLAPYREEALQVCVGILTDRAVPIPGVFTAGTFTFLRPPPVHVRTSELIGMAAHAVSELARPTDTYALFTLTTRLHDLDRQLQRLSYYEDDVVFGDILNQYADLLVALYLVRPENERLRLDLEDFLERIQSDRTWASTLGSSYRPIVLLRVGRYEEAVDELEMLVRFEAAMSMASAHYNLACAYAQWGSGLEGSQRARRLAQALQHLDQAVQHQWLDIGWMDQDRDLEPIRDTDHYRRLAEQVRSELIPERSEGINPEPVEGPAGPPPDDE